MLNTSGVDTKTTELSSLGLSTSDCAWTSLRNRAPYVTQWNNTDLQILETKTEMISTFTFWLLDISVFSAKRVSIISQIIPTNEKVVMSFWTYPNSFKFIDPIISAVKSGFSFYLQTCSKTYLKQTIKQPNKKHPHTF